MTAKHILPLCYQMISVITHHHHHHYHTARWNVVILSWWTLAMKNGLQLVDLMTPDPWPDLFTHSPVTQRGNLCCQLCPLRELISFSSYSGTEARQTDDSCNQRDWSPAGRTAQCRLEVTFFIVHVWAYAVRYPSENKSLTDSLAGYTIIKHEIFRS